jgi:acid phosphatase (class A)
MMPLTPCRFSFLVFPFVLAGTGPLLAAENLMKTEAKAAAVAQWHFLSPQSVDLKQLLPGPPASGSPAAEADIETVLQAQAVRTTAQVVWAKMMEQENVYKNAEVLGPWFAATNLPGCAAFFKQVMDDGALASKRAKELFDRPRPPKTDARVQACVEVPTSASYPSGHASQAWMWATILSEIFPEKRLELEERARAVCWSRIVGGVHFPSDLVSGKKLGIAIALEVLKSPAAREAIARCRAEVAPFLVRKAA